MGRFTRFKLTPELLQANYEMNALCPPFSQWNLPEGDTITFKVTRDRKVAGYHAYWQWPQKHEIGISARCVGSLMALTRIMQHEMAHLHQYITEPKTITVGVEHNAHFRRLSDQICLIHGWDRMEFADAD